MDKKPLTFHNKRHDQLPDGSSDARPRKCIGVSVFVLVDSCSIEVSGVCVGVDDVITQVRGVCLWTVSEQSVNQLISRHPRVLVEVAQNCRHTCSTFCCIINFLSFLLYPHPSIAQQRSGSKKSINFTH